ncbi:MAG: hypothetical protein KF799_00030 [Bdellovibrionales bacterium]|nr:hypothetical protein [Bdellovibrionales bacterium]
MKHILISLLLLTTAFAAHAEGKKYGVGFVLGDPSALSFRYDQTKEKAWDAQLAFSMSEYVLFYGDYLVKFPGVFNSEQEFVQQLTPYAGAGPVLVFASDNDHSRGSYFDKRSDSFAAGVRIPFGIEWRSDQFPVGIGLEIAPGIVILPNTDGFLHGGVSFRYYF